MLKRIVLWTIFWVLVFGAYKIGVIRERQRTQTIAWMQGKGKILMPYKITYDPNDRVIYMHYLDGDINLMCADDEVMQIAMSVLNAKN